MKKVLSLCLALILCLCLTACHTTPLDTPTPQSSTTDIQTTTTVSTSQTISSTTVTTTTESPTTTTAKPTTVKTTTTVPATTTVATTTTTTTVATTTVPTTTAKTTTVTTTTTAPTTTTTTVKKESSITPALYAVTYPASNTTIWLFGSIHVGEESMYPLPDYVLNAFNQADYLAVECDISDIDENEWNEALAQFVYTDLSTIDEYISARLYGDARDILKEKNEYSVYLNYYKPALWANLIDSHSSTRSKFSSEFGVDLHLIDLAKKNGKSVVEIESIKSQYGMMANFSPALQEQLLEESVLAYHAPYDDTSTKELLDLWKKGDMETLREYLSPTIPENETAEYKAMLKEYQKAMYTDRDEEMLEFAVDMLLQKKSTFICVGAAHIVGENGLIDRFENHIGINVTVTRITK